MIGNSLKTDIAPALELGMTAVWVNREANPRDESILPDAEIATLEALKGIFEYKDRSVAR